DRLSLERETTCDLAGSFVDSQKPGAEVLSNPDRACSRQKARARRERKLHVKGDLLRRKVDAEKTLLSAEHDPARAVRNRNVGPSISNVAAHSVVDSLH